MRALFTVLLLTLSLGGCMTITQGSSSCRVTATGASAALGPRMANFCDFLVDKVATAPQAIEVPGVLTFHQAPVCEDWSEESQKIIRHDVYGEYEDSKYIDPNSQYFYNRAKVAGDACYNPVEVRERTYQEFRVQQ